MTENTKKNNIINLRNSANIIVAVLIIALFAVSMVYYYWHTVINDGKLTETNPNDYAYQIENINIDNNNLRISGWCFYKDEDLSDKNLLPNMRIILAEIDNYNKLHYFDAEYGQTREDVNEYYHGDSENNYTNCGFKADIDLNALDPYKDYEVVLQQNDRKSITIRPGIFLHEGNVVYADPAIYEPLDVAGTDLELIIEKGILKVYKPDIGMYIYQYGWKLYYIADSDYPFDEGWTTIGCYVGTNCIDLLSEKRQEYGTENMSFVFADNELDDSFNTGKYRVAEYDITNDFPVMYITTGYRSSLDGWIWSSRICTGIPQDIY